jgi:hypothetical protein
MNSGIARDEDVVFAQAHRFSALPARLAGPEEVHYGQDEQNPEMNKPLPAPHVPGSTEAERMSNALSMVLTVPKQALLKREAKEKAKNARKREKARKPS